MPRNKTRSAYGVENFRGLDKENKPLRVENFRASDGYNFMIDSGTLKTRPAFRYDRDALFNLDEGEKIIGWFAYKGGKLFVTTLGFYFELNGNVYSDENPQGFMYHNFEERFDFEDKEPLFREEKDALFIFGLGGVFVFSFFKDRKIILYKLEDKPQNPFLPTLEEYHKRYEELPTPYIPTLFIGDTRVDDVNLLSKKNRYKLFSQSQSQTGKEQSYFLPTHYDEEKHEGFKVAIEFYNGRLDDVDVLPIFMGIEGENFEQKEDYGLPIGTNEELGTEANPYNIEDVYKPANDFVVRRKVTVEGEEEYTELSDVSKIFGLTPNIFFSFRIEGGNETVFDFLINYFKQQQQEIDTWENENRYFVFNLPYEAKQVIKDEVTNFVHNETIVRGHEKVYIQIKKFELLVSYENPTLLQAQAYHEETMILSEPFVTIPIPYSFDESLPENKKYYLNNNQPLLMNNYSQQNFDMMARSFLRSRQAELVGIEKVKIEAKIFREEEGSFPMTATISNQQYRTITRAIPTFSIDEEELKDPQSNDTYPQLLEQYQDYIDLGYIQMSYGSSSGHHTHLSPNDREKVENQIKTMMEEGLFDGQFRGKGYFQIGTWVDHRPHNTIYTTRRHALEVEFQKEYEGEYQVRTHTEAIYDLDIETEKTKVKDNLYSFTFNSNRNMFELKVKDFFFDYNNEPSIVVLTDFDKDPDFDKISRMKFGVTFGSENRLFLAGDEEYPNIDRYNVSNDLLGNNVANQSYELSYFPSKNYRVMGGKSPINGYVVATDTQLYVTKEKSTNDESFFIRERQMNDEGMVSYFEYKTNIQKSPINHHCLARFYNDIVMLTDEGLFGIEISSNVLTNERLLRLRSGFINEELIKDIKDKNNIFIIENNHYMYIFLDNVVYVCDSRYIDENPNGVVGNMSYEIMKWVSPITFKQGKFNEKDKKLLSDKDAFYHLDFKDKDEEGERKKAFISSIEVEGLSPDHLICMLSENYDYVLEDPKNYNVWLYDGYIRSAQSGLDKDYGITIIQGDPMTVRIDVFNHDVFRAMQEGDKVYFRNVEDDFIESNIIYYDENRDYFIVDANPQELFFSSLYFSAKEKRLYITHVFDVVLEESYKGFKLSPYEPEEVKYIEKEEEQSNEEYHEMLKGILEEDTQRYNIHFETESLQDGILSNKRYVETYWLSNVTPLENDMMEKTMFRAFVYATKMSEDNEVYFGYKTMRSGENTSTVTTVANPSSFENFNMNALSLSSFNEMGASLPLKANNFLYIQFLIRSLGQIEMNGFKILFKNNRSIKTIG